MLEPATSTATPTTTFAPPPLPAGPLAARAEAVFEATSPYDGDGFRNHCRRLFLFTEMLLARAGVTMPRETAYAIAMCHDLGIVSRVDTGRTYLERSRSLFARELGGERLDVPQDIVDECLIYNHRLLPVPNLSPQAEAFRRAVQVEHGRGLIHHGLPRDAVRAVFAAYPRDNFDRVLLDFTWRTVRHEPWTLVRGIFF
ncbi:MAG TPA: hypothetical protein VIK91_26980 [Nannocystis sp.]